MLTPSGDYNAENPELESFLATSPPVEPNYPSLGMSPLSKRLQDEVKPLTPSRGDAHRASRTLSETTSILQVEKRPRISTVRVLNTSMPHIHEELMHIREKAKAKGQDPDLVLHPSQAPPKEPESATHPIPEEVRDEHGNPIYRSKEEQEATSKALKPHSRSVTAMNELRTLLPDNSTTAPHEEKKPAPSKMKPRRWQFGIRSRNQPYEAMRCLFNALDAQGAEWEVIPATAYDNSQDGEDEKDNILPPPPELAPGERHSILQSKYSWIAKDYYIPRDPWSIRARILKKGLLIPGEEPSISANSSVVSLPNEAKNQLKKHLEQLGGYASEDVANALGMNGAHAKSKSPQSSGLPTRQNTGHGDQAQMHGHDSFTGPGQPRSRPESLTGLHKNQASENVGVWVFIDVQLYTLETGVYVVDFKCDGYQNVVWYDPKNERAKSPTNYSALNSPSASRPTSGLRSILHGAPSSEGSGVQDEGPHWRPVSKRYINVEKENSSPYPYLDVASELVAQLASTPS
jgi:carbon catabolite-derepressing protein kinase